jgi:hypothetical protein
MSERHDELLGLVTLWTAAVATLLVAVRSGSFVLVLLALPLFLMARRLTVLHGARRPREPRADGGRELPVARVTRLRPRSTPAPERRSTAA